MTNVRIQLTPKQAQSLWAFAIGHAQRGASTEVHQALAKLKIVIDRHRRTINDKPKSAQL